jgi:hypothetical protein
MKGGSDLVATEDIPHKHADLPHAVAAEVTRVRLAAVTSPRQA